jgi:hypothetical protein
MITCAGEREPLGDDALKREQAKAEEYVSHPERIALCSMQLGMESTHAIRVILYNDGQWGCTCAFFQDFSTCSHIMAVGRILKRLLIIQPYGNEEISSATMGSEPR